MKKKEWSSNGRGSLEKVFEIVFRIFSRFEVKKVKN